MIYICSTTIITLGALAFATCARAEAQLGIDVPDPPSIPADGKSISRLTVHASTGTITTGIPVKARIVSGTAKILNPSGATRSGTMDILIQSREKAGDLVVAVDANAKTQQVTIHLTEPVTPPDFARVFASLSGFVLMMLIFSISAEKATDFMKLIYVRVLKLNPPKGTVKDLLGISAKDLVMSSTVEQLKNVCAAIDVDVDGKTTAPELIKPIFAKEAQLEDAMTTWSWGLRLWAFFFGTIIAYFTSFEAVGLLAPIAPALSSLGPLTRAFLTGAGASAGAAFWQDFLDRLTAWKRSAEGLQSKS